MCQTDIKINIECCFLWNLKNADICWLEIWGCLYNNNIQSAAGTLVGRKCLHYVTSFNLFIYLSDVLRALTTWQLLI